jgi:hypothetical protein
MAATRIANLSGIRNGLDQAAAALAALTSFEFYDALAGEAPNQAALIPDQAAATILNLARDLLSRARS